MAKLHELTEKVAGKLQNNLVERLPQKAVENPGKYNEAYRLEKQGKIDTLRSKARGTDEAITKMISEGPTANQYHLSIALHSTLVSLWIECQVLERKYAKLTTKRENSTPPQQIHDLADSSIRKDSPEVKFLERRIKEESDKVVIAKEKATDAEEKAEIASAEWSSACTYAVLNAKEEQDALGRKIREARAEMMHERGKHSLAMRDARTAAAEVSKLRTELEELLVRRMP